MMTRPPDPLDRFLDAAARHAARPAVIAGDGAVTYAALLARAAGFAARFAARAAPGVLIAVPGGADAYAAMLGAGFAGGYYVPLNVEAPLAKLTAIAKATAPDIIVGEGPLLAALAAAAPGALLVEPGLLKTQPAPSALPDRPRHALAYVIFTSGSTGAPKGVRIPRAALAHFVGWLERSLAPGPQDRFAQFGNIGFDISVTDIYGALCFGAALCPPATRHDRLFPARLIRRARITVWNSVPSLVSLMMRVRDVTAENFATLRLMNFCGEPLLAEHLEAIFAARPDLAVQNTYGPTEATVSMTELPLTRATYKAHTRETVAIGAPIAGMGLHLVGGPTPDEGELVITGPQLADGYWREPAKSAAFRLFTPAGGTTAGDTEAGGGALFGYFTGDWAERRDGRIFFKSRRDFQVKVRGFRVELEEVASAIRAHGWPVVVVLKRGDAIGAVVEAAADEAFDGQALQAALAARLDRHAIPAWIVPTPAMPRNENDKIDRRGASAYLEERLGAEPAHMPSARR